MVKTPGLPDVLTVQEALAATAASSAGHTTTCHKISTLDSTCLSSNGNAGSQWLTAKIILAGV